MSDILTHPISAVIILLGLLIIVHEAGHYLVGRWCGIAVETFSVGFGPRILGFRWRGTDFRISVIPLGGFVKFAGAHPSEEIPEGLEGIPFRDATVWQRVATVAAGPVANFILAVAVFAGLGMVGISHPPPFIGAVMPGSAADQAGIRYGDVFLRLDGRDIRTWRDLEEIIAASPEKPLALTVRRDGRELELSLTPSAVEAEDMAGRKTRIGRAGIALGALPSLVAVTTAGSPADVAGLVTGDRVDSLAVADGPPLSVKAWPELQQRLDAAVAAGAAAVTLTVTRPEFPRIPAEGAALSAPAAETPLAARTVVLSLAAAGGLKGDALTVALGLSDTQLTVADASETVAGVLKPGDRILAFGGLPTASVYDLRERIFANTGPEVTLRIQRGFNERDLQVNLKGVEVQKPEGPATIYTLPALFLGQPLDTEPIVEKYGNPLTALVFGLKETGRQTWELCGNIASLVTGDIPIRALGGPMLIAKVAGDSARRGWQTFVGSMALISINLGLLNLFPIPVLDGGQLLLLGAEGLRRRPLRERAIENFQKVGFAMILALVVLATYNDLRRFWRSMLESVAGLFQ